MVAGAFGGTMQSSVSLSPEESAVFFEHRFRFAGKGHPAADAMYTLAEEWLAYEPAVYKPVPPPPAGAPLAAPVDPVDIVQMEVRLPPLPAVLVELQEVILRRHSSADQIAEVISKDPGLAAWLLRLVNSPYYGFSAKVATISRAVALVGTRQIQTLAMGGALNSLAVLMPKGLIDMQRFWRHSLAVAITAQEIWKLTGRQEAEQLFVAGLLHDCGKLTMAYAAPKVVEQLRRSSEYASNPDYAAEQKILGFDHARLGGMLLHRWNMPLPLVMSVLRHHTVEDPVRYPEAAATHVAEVLVTALGVSATPGAFVPPLSPEAWDVLGLVPQKLNFIAGMLHSKLDTLCAALQK